MGQQSNIAEKPTECAACGGPIIQPHGQTKEFCSISCFRAGRAFCKSCGKPLSQPEKGSRNGSKKTFCSIVCKTRYELSGVPVSSSFAEEWDRSACKACGKPIIQNKHAIRQFCSAICYSRYHASVKRGLDLLQRWGSYAPETRKVLLELEQLRLGGLAKRLATAIDREYSLRYQGKNSRLIAGSFITCHCKACGKEFRRRSWAHTDRDYCSRKCRSPIGKSTGETNNSAKLTWEQVDEIRHLHATEPLSLSELGRRYGVSHTVISNIVTCKRWKPKDDPRRKD